MAIRMMATNHVTTLPTLFTLPLAESSNPRQHNNINIAEGEDCVDGSQQHDTQYNMRTRSNNLQPIDMLSPEQSTNQGSTRQPDGLQCQGYGNQLTHNNHSTKTITPTPNLTHVENTTLYYQKKQKKSLYNYPSISHTTIKIMSPTTQTWRPSPAPLPQITNKYIIALRLTWHDRYTPQHTSQPQPPQLQSHQLHPHPLNRPYNKRIDRFHQILLQSKSHRRQQLIKTCSSHS